MGKLLCGASESIMTPEFNVFMPGYFADRRSIGKKDDLYTHAVVLENDGKVIVMISLDAIQTEAPVTKRIRDGIAKRIPVDKNAIMVSSIHIHTGATCDPVPDATGGILTDADKRAIDLLVNRTVENTVAAYEKRVPVKIGFGTGEVIGISFRRHYWMKSGAIYTFVTKANANEVIGPAGEIDYSVGVLRLDGEDGKPVAQIVNFACHPDCVGGNEYCTDWPGEMRRIVKREMGEDMVVCFLNGCCGNVNHLDGERYQKNPDSDGKYPADHYKWMGARVAEEVLRINKELVTEEKDATLDFSLTRFREARRQPTEHDLMAAEALLQKPEMLSASYRTHLEEIKMLHEKPMHSHMVELQTLRVGDCGFVALPFEVFADTGLRIKENSPFKHNMLATNANMNFGYLPTEPAFGGGPKVYEARLAVKNSIFGPKTADRVIKVSGEMLDKMSNQ